MTSILDLRAPALTATDGPMLSPTDHVGVGTLHGARAFMGLWEHAAKIAELRTSSIDNAVKEETRLSAMRLMEHAAVAGRSCLARESARAEFPPSPTHWTQQHGP